MRRKNLFAVPAALLMAASCTLFAPSSGPLSDTEISAIQSRIMTTFEILNGSAGQTDRALAPFAQRASPAQSRATVPVFSSGPYALPASGVSSPEILTNYPEVGQTSAWTAESTAAPDVYLIKARTDFPSGDLRDFQDEWYYIKSDDSTWTVADLVTDASGAENARFRAKNELTYTDGSVQSETIVSIRGYSGHDGFAAFGVDGGLDYPGAFMPGTNADASYSSVVVYTRNYADAPAFSFWNGNRVRTIVGVRYYTEILDAANTAVTGSMIVFEKAITSLYSAGGDFLDAYSSLFLPTLSGAPEQAMLALTVIRQESTYKVATYAGPVDYTLDYDDASNTRDTRAMTRVVNIAAQQDSYVTLINDEAALITEAYDTLWIPSGDDAAIVDLSTAETIDVKASNTTVSVEGSGDVAVVTDDVTGEIGALYASVGSGTLTGIGLSDDIAGDLTGEGDLSVFDGGQGTVLPNPASSYATLKGTVQAWVYISGATNTAGIVHAGIKSDFSDELWTLQFMGTSTAPVFGLAAQGPYKYDLVTSSQKLNLRRWHYVVATWDLAGDSMKVYVDGRLRGTSAFANVRTTSTFASSSPVVIGSQLFDDEKVLAGYYGFNGKINGVLIDDKVWSADEISVFYESNKTRTADW